MMSRLDFPAIVAIFITWSVSTESADAEVQFSRDIRPIFNQHCIACHGGVKQAADLSFVYRDQALTVIEPGSPEDSYLLERVTSEDDEERMPPPEHGRRLSEQEVQLLRDWIRQGAKWQNHWAFDPPHHGDPPPTRQTDWCRQPIDEFVLGRLEAEGLRPSPDAAPDRWLRRVSLDLIGLPPTPEERRAFLSSVAQSGEAAYEPEVRRLLDSPHFGERWASVWLDLVRYADSKGLGQDGRRTIWKYRDWVIRAFNRDMPFDEFTIKQLAGDLLPEARLDDLVATACHRSTQTNEEGGTDDEQFRVEAVIDRVNTTWQTWLGLTFGCAQCHNHPYDPIRNEEYYRFLAFFNSTVDCDLSNDDPRLPVPMRDEDYERATRLDREIVRLEERIWQSGFQLMNDSSRWRALTGLQAKTTNQTRVVVEARSEGDEFHTVGTVSQDTSIVLEAPIPQGLDQITAVRFTGLPLDPVKAEADSEWGFVLSYVEAVLIVPQTDTPQPVELSRVVADEPRPLHDPQLSLNEKNPQGFGAYSRINHARRAAFVLAKPLAVSPGSRLRITLSHKITELGAFPLVTRRGRLDVTDSDEFTRWLADPADMNSRRDLSGLLRERAAIRSVRIPVMRELHPPLSRPTHVFERGNFLNKGARVAGGTPKSLPPLPPTDHPTRLDLAQWIADADNPLTGRVIVNRVWGQMFGIGLVETQEDFGSSGEPPSHPQLLDDLAARFTTEMGWSIKRLLYEIALSSTYRQSSKVTPEVLAKDPRNRLLARGPRTRLPAETIRDQALAIAGLLSDDLFGPPVYPPLPQNVWKPFQGGDRWRTPKPGDSGRYRRAVYTYTKRSIPYPMFASFDAPSREFCTARRLRSNTPLQALMTLNDEAFAEASRALAHRMLSAGDTPEEQIAFGVLVATCRQADATEVQQLVRLYEDSLPKRSAGPTDEPSGATDTAAETAMANVASVLLNLDEVLCK